MLSTYTDVLRRPGVAAFVLAGFVGRLPISMIPLGIVLMVTAYGSNFAVAGALSAVYALSAAVLGPWGARWMDRRGQAAAAPPLLALQVMGLLSFAALVSTGRSPALAAAALVVAGGCTPNIGSMVRARWAAMLNGEPGLRSGFAVEGIIDEVIFIVGPPLVTVVALRLSEPWALALCAALATVGGLWLAAQRATQPAPRRRTAGSARQGFVSRGFVLVTAALAAMGAMFGAFEVTTVALTRELGHEGATGLVLALYAIGSLVTGLIFGARHAVASVPVQFAVAGVVLAVIVLPLPLVTSLPALAVAACVAGMGVSPLLIMAVGLVERLVPAARLTEALTVTTSGLAVGLAVGAPVAGHLIDTVSASAGYLVVVGGAAVAGLVSVASMPVLRRSLAGPDESTP